MRSIGVASAAAALALGVAGNAFACSITEFAPSVACVSDHGVVSVIDTDNTTHVTITVKLGDKQVGQQTDVIGTKAGVKVDIPIDVWQPKTEYTVTVVKANGDKVGDKPVTTPDEACAAPTTPPPTTPPPTTTPPTTTPASPTTSTTPTVEPTASPTPTPTGTTVAPVVDDTNAPSPAAGGSTNLAETGGGSNTGMIAGVAAALVLVGGGSVFALRRRKPAAH